MPLQLLQVFHHKKGAESIYRQNLSESATQYMKILAILQAFQKKWQRRGREEKVYSVY